MPTLQTQQAQSLFPEEKRKLSYLDRARNFKLTRNGILMEKENSHLDIVLMMFQRYERRFKPEKKRNFKSIK